MHLETIVSFAPALLAAALVFSWLITGFLSICPRLRSMITVIFNPFSQFLELADLSELRELDLANKLPESLAIPKILRTISSVTIVLSLSFGCVLATRQLLLCDVILPFADSWTAAAVLGVLLATPIFTAPVTLVIIHLLLLISACYTLLARLSDNEREHLVLYYSLMKGSLSLAFVALAGFLPLRPSIPGFNVAHSSGNITPNKSLSNPEDGVSFWSWCTFSFVQPIMDLASTRTLNAEDAWSLSPYFKHRNLFEKQLEYRKLHPTHSILRFLLASNSLDLIIVVLLELWKAVVGFVPPFALNRLLQVIASPDAYAPSTPYYYALLTFVAHMSFAQADLFHNYHSRRAYERTRGQLFCAIHYKALRRRDLSGHGVAQGAKEETADLGKVVNIMQGDSYGVAHRFWQFSQVFTSPVRLVLALVFLYRVLGPSSMVGVLVLVSAYIITYPLARYNISITRSMWASKDKRLNSISELFQNIRFLKYYGWENLWTSNIILTREEELKWRIKENIIDTGISFIWTWIPSAVALTAFVSYTIVFGRPLTVSQAFTSISLFEQLKEPMRALPEQIFALLHAYVSMQRIEKYMHEEEVPGWASSLFPSDHSKPSSKLNPTSLPIQDLPDDSSIPLSNPIGFGNANLTWYIALNSNPFHLILDIRFNPGINLIIGATGSGKTALLCGLLGELQILSGTVWLPKAGHMTAYCAQHPFLEHGTVRDNIIFGSPIGYDAARYRRVIEACALAQDLSIFTTGDFTEIGDRGVTLSGGQKSRIALARAVYSDAKIVLLDDPLSAVDVHTAQHIFDNCICGDLMKGRTVILVSHQVALCLPKASYVMEMSHGRITKQGCPGDFVTSGSTPSFSEYNKDEDGALQEPLSQSGKSGADSDAEFRAEGRVSLRTYLLYMKAAGWIPWGVTIMLVLAIRALSLIEQIFLAKWGEAYESEDPSTSPFHVASLLSWKDLPSPYVNVRPWVTLYAAISLSGAASALVYISLGYFASIRASRRLFLGMLLRLIRAPIQFFDSTPLGRILNRFTTDISTIDGAIQNSARAALSGVINFIISFGVIVVLIPQFAPVALLIASIYIILAPNYIRASRDLRRLESLALSPAFAGFDELLRGLAHIRAYAMELRYQHTFYDKVDAFQNFDHIYWQVSGWLRWRYDVLGSIIVLCTTCFALLEGLSDGLAALVIVQAGVFAEASRQLVRVGAQLELDFNSVERVGEYLDVPQEAPPVLNKRPPAYWPSSSGAIFIENLVVRYSSSGPDALRGISLFFAPCEKIGIVGRTGSGKSTLAMSLLRIVEPFEGHITIDGIDISTLGLDDLRSNVTVVSQDVAIFSGTIRENLDPAGIYTDHECWDVLTRCRLTSTSDGHHAPIQSLYSMLSPQGSLSAGERQLVALARAVLRRSRVVILDEATSHMSHELDAHIQTVIKEELVEATVITIAHRLKFTLGLDRVVVLQNGMVKEFDKPSILLADSQSLFAQMCRNSPDWPFE